MVEIGMMKMYIYSVKHVKKILYRDKTFWSWD